MSFDLVISFAIAIAVSVALLVSLGSAVTPSTDSPNWFNICPKDPRYCTERYLSPLY
jgi:hypothetical protein